MSETNSYKIATDSPRLLAPVQMVTGGGGPGEAKALFVLGMLHALQRSAQARNAFLLKKLLGVA